MTNIPKHIAIIPDGNRRWAKSKGLKSWDGHYEGAKRFEELVDESFTSGVKNLTFWGSSMDNLKKRPLKEKIALLDIYEKYFSELISNERIFKDKIKINIIGKWREQFPEKLIKLLEKGIKKTKNHKQYALNFLLAYNGDDDIITAVKNIATITDCTSNDINAKLFQENLMSKEIPVVDLVIRTGVENDPHNSAGFLMWQTQNSQLHFTDLRFPDFTASKLKLAIKDFSHRTRRLGK